MKKKIIALILSTLTILTTACGQVISVADTPNAANTLPDEVISTEINSDEDHKETALEIEEVSDTSSEVVNPEIPEEISEGITSVDEHTEEVVTEGPSVEAVSPELSEQEEVIFDHYFTEIDELLVETTELFVKTSDPSVFTSNTNIISNYDDVYIIGCESVDEARYVYSYYIDKVDFISDLSEEFSISSGEDNEDADTGNTNEENSALTQLGEEIENTINVDYSDYIALIDTGADEADIKLSVVGEDTSDANGHGSRMLSLIKNENPDVKVMSIKVFNGATTDAASVYAGIRLAIENNVKIINLSFVSADTERNAVVKEIIQEAINRGITVIGAAGNYNLPADNYIPGCIEGVITIGAANRDGSKSANSNYNADYYVVASATSDATAIYTGFYSAGITENERIFNGDFEPTVINESESTIDPADRDLSDLDENPFLKAIVEQTGYDYSIDDDGTVHIYIPEIREEIPDFVMQGTATGVETSFDAINSLSVGATYTGTCSYSAGSPGYGTATITGSGNAFEQIFNGKTIDCECEGHGSNSTQSSYAFVLSPGTVNYQATVTGITESGGKKYASFSVLFSNDGFGARSWTPKNWRR